MLPGSAPYSFRPPSLKASTCAASMPSRWMPFSASAGFKSWCTEPHLWIAASPFASSAPSRSTAVASQWSALGDDFLQRRPGMYAVTSHGDAASGSASTIWAVWNPPTRRAASTSRANRARNCESCADLAVAASSGRTTFTAPLRPAADVPRKTCPMPPAPSRPPSWYGPMRGDPKGPEAPPRLRETLGYVCDHPRSSTMLGCTGEVRYELKAAASAPRLPRCPLRLPLPPCERNVSPDWSVEERIRRVRADRTAPAA